jgi:hypothetical protein
MIMVVLAVFSLSAGTALAKDVGTVVGSSDPTGGDVEVGIDLPVPGSPGAPTGPSGPTGSSNVTVTCSEWDADAPTGSQSDVSQFKIGDTVLVVCEDTATGATVSVTTITWQGAAAVPQVDPADLALHAKERLDLPLPLPRSWPDIATAQITGIATWLHVDNFTAATKTATAGGVSATVRADPVVVDWRMGDGGHVVCHDAGAVYAPGSATTCSYGFTTRSTGQGDGRFHGTVTITWHLRWDSNVGRAGDLGDVSRTAVIDRTVHELQALIN